MLKKIPVGVSDFKEIIKEDYYYIDKSLFVKELVDDGSKVILIPRPRRFGKTLNLSMLKYFFDLSEKDNLFEHLKIWQNDYYHKEKGKYPVIFMTFKDIKSDNFEDCIYKVKKTISSEFKKFRYLLDSGKLDSSEKSIIQKCINQEGEKVEYESALELLSKCLEAHHGEKVVILIDEYDIPIQSGYLNNYYDEIINFMRNFLSAGLKDNVHLRKGVITGILRVSKESIFSELNNILVSTILDKEFSDSFGLLEEEVFEMLKYYNIDTSMDEVKTWYNGYIFGNSNVYNPWSIINFVHRDNEKPQPFWINTSSNDLVKRLITKGGSDIKSELELLISGKYLTKKIDSNIVMSEIENSSDSLWTLLLFSGYLKSTHIDLTEDGVFCNLEIPNLEVRYLFKDIISSWFTETIKQDKFELMLKSLISADFETFGEIFSYFVQNSLSYFDIGKDPEKTYHAFVLGILIALPSKNYTVKSNRESGFGRYDVMIIPNDKNNIGIIIEFKKVSVYRKETLETALQKAFDQIENKNYKQELIDLGVKTIYEVGIAIDGKDILLDSRLSK